MNIDNKPQFTICVPTFNRGAKALSNVQKLLPDLADDWELLVLDNASTISLEEYRQIAGLAESDSRISYKKQQKNGGFHGNYLACFREAKADHMMIVSDEDLANPTTIKMLLPKLLSSPTLALLRGAIEPMPGCDAKNSHIPGKDYYKSGEEAMMNYTFANNYLSGTIYNRKLLQSHGLIERLAAGLEKNRIYPHLYMDILIAAVGDMELITETVCFEGESEITLDGDEFYGKGPTSSMDYVPPYSFGSRLDQIIILRDGAAEAVAMRGEPFDYRLFSNLYLRLCNKYFDLVTNTNSHMYAHNHIHTGLLQKGLLYTCCAAISIYPGMEQYNKLVIAELAKMFAHHELKKTAAES